MNKENPKPDNFNDVLQEFVEDVENVIGYPNIEKIYNYELVKDWLESTRPEKPQSDIKDTLLEKLEKINSIQAERIGRMGDLLEKILTEIEKEKEFEEGE